MLVAVVRGRVLLILPLVCDAPSGVLFRAVARVDAVLLVLEALALTALLLLAMADRCRARRRRAW